MSEHRLAEWKRLTYDEKSTASEDGSGAVPLLAQGDSGDRSAGPTGGLLFRTQTTPKFLALEKEDVRWKHYLCFTR